MATEIKLVTGDVVVFDGDRGEALSAILGANRDADVRVRWEDEERVVHVNPSYVVSIDERPLWKKWAHEWTHGGA
jgi:hypothetical protein